LENIPMMMLLLLFAAFSSGCRGAPIICDGLV
jgi:hypothetical protein